MVSPVMLDESTGWKVSGMRTAEGFFRALHLLLPEATHIFLEGSPNSEIEALLLEALDEVGYAAPVGTIWSWPQKDRRFSVRASPLLFERLADAASHLAEPEVCTHVHLYRDREALLQWFDACADPLLVSRALDRDRVEQFARVAGGVVLRP
jgi:hypothetical protein